MTENSAGVYAHALRLEQQRRETQPTSCPAHNRVAGPRAESGSDAARLVE